MKRHAEKPCFMAFRYRYVANRCNTATDYVDPCDTSTTLSDPQFSVRTPGHIPHRVQIRRNRFDAKATAGIALDNLRVAPIMDLRSGALDLEACLNVRRGRHQRVVYPCTGQPGRSEQHSFAMDYRYTSILGGHVGECEHRCRHNRSEKKHPCASKLHHGIGWARPFSKASVTMA
jgi:hypothetical protein